MSLYSSEGKISIEQKNLDATQIKPTGFLCCCAIDNRLNK